MGSVFQELSGKLDDGIAAFAEVVIADTNVEVGFDTELSRVALCVVGRDSRETDVPSVGQRRVEGHAGSAASMVAYNLH